METPLLRLKSNQYRQTIIKIIREAKAGHTGGSLSCIDILNVLYNHVMDIKPENFGQISRDHYVHSKGHSVEALYTVLCDKGFFSHDTLMTMEKYGSDLIGHPTRRVPGMEQNTGALGHGLSFAVGMALAGKKSGHAYRVFTVLGDGELTEGSVWEAAFSAAHYELDNLTAIVDRNGLQITGFTEEVMKLEPLEEKLRAFGFGVRHADGNDPAELSAILQQLPFEPGRPSLLMAHTVKGKGVSFMEGQASWHHRVPTDEEFVIAMQELDAEREALQSKHGSLETRQI